MGTTTVNAAEFADLFDPARRRDPHGRYHELRAAHPVATIEPGGDVILTRFDDCEAVLRDPTWSVDPGTRGERVNDDDVGFLGGMDISAFPVMLLLDPPDHTRLRRLVSKAFTPRTVEKMRPRIELLLGELLDERRGTGAFDLMSEVAYPFPVTVICELLGVPVEDHHQFGGWSSDAARLLDGEIDAATAERGVTALFNFIGYFDQLFERRRAAPGDDLISQLLAVEDEGDVLDHLELQATCVLLFVAGHETTMNLIGNGTHALLTHPEQWHTLVDDPAHAAGAVEETLRWNGPVHLTGRTATREVVVNGWTYRPGDDVTLLLAAANRDPARHADPDRFDIARSDNRHLTFSHGLHYCLGAALARLEGQVFFETLAREHAGAALVTDNAPLRDHLVLRGFDRLEVELR